MICKLCNKKNELLGMPSHVSRVHKISFKEYKEKFLMQYHKCEICGNDVSNEKRFCSRKCAGIYGSKCVKKHKNRYTTNNHIILQKLNINLKNEIIRKYVDLESSIIDLSKEYGLKYEIVHLLLRQNNIEINKNMFAVSLRKKNKKEFEDFANSKIVLEMVKRYKKCGENIRSLSRKYNVRRQKINKLLEFHGVKLKTNKEARNEVRIINKEYGKNHHRYGKLPSGGRIGWYYFDGIKYQGSWEFKVGLWLRENKRYFVCHKNIKRFEYIGGDGRLHTYCPDFYIIDADEYWEVKGFYSYAAQKKMKIVGETYPDVNIKLIDYKKMKQMGIWDIDKKIGINLSKYMINAKNCNFIMDDFLSKHDKEDIMRERIIENKNVENLAKKYDIPRQVMLTIIPRVGSKEYNEYKLRFIVEDIGRELINDYKSGFSIQELKKKYKIKYYRCVEIIGCFNVKLRNSTEQRYVNNFRRRIIEIGENIKCDYLKGMSKIGIREKYGLTTKKQLNDILNYYGLCRK